jgi:hypothetical protein
MIRHIWNGGNRAAPKAFHGFQSFQTFQLLGYVKINRAARYWVRSNA